ncbi:MAG: YfiT family bacillithiol transferase [Deinococcota bacterium]
MSTSPDDLRYPIGKFQFPENVTEADHARWRQIIADTPTRLREAVSGLDDSQLDTQYRPEGWTLRQVVHHIADSHINSIVRFKLALTEDSPPLKPYREGEWANLADSSMPIDVSLDLLTALHARWAVLLESLTPEDLKRTLTNPNSGKLVPLERNLAVYAWHGPHHIAHITTTRDRNGW